jgi:hypothetical protein
MTRSIVLALAISTGCAGSIDVRGGPNAVSVKLSNSNVARQLGTLVAGDARAAQRAADLEGREGTAKLLLYSEFAMVGLCIGSGYTENFNATIGICLSGIALGIAAIIVAPGKKAYASPLRLYNKSHPEARFTSSRLDVE